MSMTTEVSTNPIYTLGAERYALLPPVELVVKSPAMEALKDITYGSVCFTNRRHIVGMITNARHYRSQASRARLSSTPLTPSKSVSRPNPNPSLSATQALLTVSDSHCALVASTISTGASALPFSVRPLRRVACFSVTG